MAPESTSKSNRPQRIGKYEVVRHIASGGMGAVYRAVDSETGRDVALKVLSPTLAAKANMLERFRREAKSAARLRHENIVELYDVDEFEGINFIALEFVDGVDLYQYICAKEKLDPQEALQIVIQAARALDHAHKQSIVHRDIKPSNFLISRQDGRLNVKLTDMGLARIVLDEQLRGTEEFRVTNPGTTVGTVDYMSPEQGRDSGTADIRSDIYSLGCTLYHMLAGEPPFNEGSLIERLHQHAEGPIPDVRSHNPAVPEWLGYILGKMLAKQPGDRYQTPAELLHDLEHPERIRRLVGKSETLATLAELAALEAPARTIPPMVIRRREKPDPAKVEAAPEDAPGDETADEAPEAAPDSTPPRRKKATPYAVEEVEEENRPTAEPRRKKRPRPEAEDDETPETLPDLKAKKPRDRLEAEIEQEDRPAGEPRRKKRPRPEADDETPETLPDLKPQKPRDRVDAEMQETEDTPASAPRLPPAAPRRKTRVREDEESEQDTSPSSRSPREGRYRDGDRAVSEAADAPVVPRKRTREDLDDAEKGSEDTGRPRTRSEGKTRSRVTDEDDSTSPSPPRRSRVEDKPRPRSPEPDDREAPEPEVPSEDAPETPGWSLRAGVLGLISLPVSLFRSSAPTTETAAKKQPGPEEQVNDEATSAPTQQKWWLLGAAAVVAVTAGVIAVLQNNQPAPRPNPETKIVPMVPQPSTTTPITAIPGKPVASRGSFSPGPELPNYPRLYIPAKALDLQALRKEYQGPFEAFPAPAADAVLVRVSRFASPGGYSSLAAALAATPADRQTVIEIHDNGPLFEAALPDLDKRRVFLRAGAGYRPLVAWDTSSAKEMKKEGAFLTLKSGKLVLENLDVVIRCSDVAKNSPACLFHMRDSDFAARSCTFSVTGKSSRGISLVRLEADPARKPTVRARFSRCHARGPSLIAVDLQPSAGAILLDGCLFVGAEFPLLTFTCPDDATSSVRVLRSTLVSGKNLLSVQPTNAKGAPHLSFLLWDSILACQDTTAEAAMLAGPDISLHNISWKPVNCLYSGWKKLVAAWQQSIAAKELDAFRKQWRYSEGDRDTAGPWPIRPQAPLEESGLAAYTPEGTSACFAATASAGAVGCALALLPAAPERWLQRTFEPVVFPVMQLGDADAPPSIPEAGDGRYHGERLDLNEVDLGQVLQARLADAQPAERVVLHLSGQGERTMSPVRIHGVKQLVLYFETPDKLTLTPDQRTIANRHALFEIEDGSLEMIGARVRFASSKFVPLPRHMISIRNGSLHLIRCRLEGATENGPEYYQGLVHFQTGAGAAPSLICEHSVLSSGKTLIRVEGRRLHQRLRNSVVLSSRDLFQIDSRPDAGPLVMSWLWEQSTLGAREKFLNVVDPPAGLSAEQPLVIKAAGNLFLTPFAPAQEKPCLLHASADALSQGIVLWRGDKNGYDQKGISRYVPPAMAALADWSRLWGPLGEKEGIALDLPVSARGLDPGQPPALERLQLPAGILRAGRTPPGADLVQLGIVKRR